MTRQLIPLMAALLLTSACTCHKKTCANRYCPPAAPTRCCQQASPQSKCGCSKAKPKARPQRCRAKQYTLRTSPNRRMVTLQNLLDYLPGTPPGYTSI